MKTHELGRLFTYRQVLPKKISLGKTLVDLVTAHEKYPPYRTGRAVAVRVSPGQIVGVGWWGGSNADPRNDDEIDQHFAEALKTKEYRANVQEASDEWQDRARDRFEETVKARQDANDSRPRSVDRQYTLVHWEEPRKDARDERSGAEEDPS